MVAVVIPAYNRPEQLREALNSLVMQTKKDFFTIVIDDCGEIDLSEVCGEFVDKLNIKCFRRKENGGPGMARQSGLDICYRAHIDFVIFLDSDDLLMPNAIKKLTYEITRHTDDIVMSTISVETKNGSDFLIYPKNSARVWLHGKIFRTAFLQKNGIRFDEGLRGNEDVSFLIKCMGLTKKVSMLEDSLYLWRDEKSSITRENGSARDGVLGLDYITAVCNAIKFLDSKGVNVYKHILYMFYCYEYYQVGLGRTGSVPKEIDTLLREVFSLENVKKGLNDIRSWDELSRSVHQFKVIDKKIIFFKQNFLDWLDMLGVDYDKSNYC